MVVERTFFDRYGVEAPPGLFAEAAEGITDCFLSPALRREIESRGVTVIKCDRRYLVAVARDTIGAPESATVAPRQPLVVTIFPRDMFPNLIPQSTTRTESELAPEVGNLIRSTFHIDDSERTLRFWALVDPSNTFFGSVVVQRDPSNVCEFKYIENPLPQSVCFSAAGSVIIKIETNSLNYTAIQAFMRNFSNIDWMI